MSDTNGPANTVRVVQFQRRAEPGAFSVERIFEDVRSHMPPDIDVALRINTYPSRGIVGRLRDALAVRRQQGQVNHVTGDVHYLAWFLPRRRTVLSVLDCVTLQRLSGPRRWLFWLLWYWWPLRHAAQVTTLSQDGADELLRWVRYPRERITVVPPPLSHEFRRAPPPPRRARPRLLQVGITVNKNIPRLLQALRGLDVTLVIVGQLDADLRKAISESGVEVENLVGLTREQLVGQYRQADLVTFVSTYEGFGMPIIEAQAVGRPVITSTVCSMPEASGGAACLVDPHDVAAIRAGVERLLGDRAYADELVLRGFANADNYRPERIADRYAQVYRKVARELESAA